MKNAPARGWDFPAAAILFIAIQTSAQRLVAAAWSEHLEAAAALAAFGALLGLALGQSRFRRGAVVLLVAGYSLFAIPWVTGSALYADIAWNERLGSMAGRLAATFSLLADGQEVQDTFLFILLVSAAYWAVSLSAGYNLARRGNYIAAILPAGIALFIIQLYDAVPARAAFLAFYLLCCLLLLGRLSYLKKRIHWQERNISLSSEASMDLNAAILVGAIALVLLAFLAPAPERLAQTAGNLWEKVSAPWEQFFDDIGKAFAGLEGSQARISYEFYGDTLSLGEQAISGEDIIFTARIPASPRLVRYYWRARIYDTYAGSGWSASAAFDQDFDPAEPLLEIIHPPEAELAEVTFTIAQPWLATLYTPPSPLWVSRAALVAVTPIGKGQVDPLFFRAATPIQSGERYSVRISVANPTVGLLRQAGSDYPAWITDRYLQLPDDLSPRIRELALQLASAEATPYNKAVAITGFLRRTIRYSKIITLPPGRDPLEWFLFDYKQGFCNYYATAEVILLRAAGIPARLVVGFAQGESGAQAGTYTVRERDAHAWPEAFFPGIGWVEFEPTSSQPALARPSDDLAADQPSAALPIPERDLPGEDVTSAERSTARPGTAAGGTPGLWSAIALGLGLAAAAAAGILAWRRKARPVILPPLPVMLKSGMERLSLSPPRWLSRWAYFAALNPIARAFESINQSLRWLGFPPAPADTPAERAQSLTGLLPEAGLAIKELLHQHQEAFFSQRPGSLFPARRSAALIRRRAWGAALRCRLKVFAAFKKYMSFVITTRPEKFSCEQDAVQLHLEQGSGRKEQHHGQE